MSAHRLMGYGELADILRVTPGAVRNLYSANPGRLPPAIVLPGFRGPRWDEKMVEDWLSGLVVKPEPVLPGRGLCKRKRGRPRIWQRD